MRKKYKINIFITIIFVALFTSIILLNIISNKVLPIFIDYVSSEMKNISINIITETISSELKNIDEDMLVVTKNNNNEIQMIDFNSKKVNSILYSVNKEVLNKLKGLESGNINTEFYSKKIVYEIPLGSATNNIFLGNFGPKIPVKLNIIGDITSNIKSNIKEYGINNALLEISISINITEKVIIPFRSEKINVNVNMPVFIKLIQGNIPEYYGGFFSRNSGILSIPNE